MIKKLPLKEMSLNDKSMLIEMIWDDIIRECPDFSSPGWHVILYKNEVQGSNLVRIN